MSKGALLGCIAALATMLLFDLLISLSGWQLDLPLETGFGGIPLGSLLVTVLKYNALAIGLSLAAAWFGAMLGERLGERRVGVPG